MENNNRNMKQSTPVLSNPTETRRLTDQSFVPFFPLSVLLWLGIGINEILKGSVSTLVWQDFKRICPDFLIYGVTAVLVIILFLFLLNMLKDDWLVRVVTSFIILLILIAMTGIFWKLFYIADLDLKWSLLVLSVLVIIIFYNANIFICLNELGETVLGSVIGQPIRAIVHSSPVLLFSLVTIFSSMIVLIITVIMAFYIFIPYMFYLIYTPSEFTWDWLLMRLRVFTFALSSIYIFNFTWNFGFIVKVDYFSNYYNNNDASWIQIFQSITRVSRYHLGTIAFLTLPVLPSLCALVVALKNNKQLAKQSDYKLINFISKISLIIDISEYALVQTSIYGTDTLTSIRQTVDLHYSNPLIFLTLNAVPVKIMDLIKITAMIAGWVALLVKHTIFASQSSIVTLGLAVIFVHSIITLLVRPASCIFATDKMSRNQKESKTLGEQSEIDTKL